MKQVVLLFAVVALSACVSTNVMKTTKEFEPVDSGATILLLEPDTQLGQLTASGMVEPRADWTESAVDRITRQIQSNLSASKHDFVTGVSKSELTQEELQLVKLHGAVGDTIVTFKQGTMSLPTKQDTFDWSLGPRTSQLSESYDSDYALFVTARGSYASSGRVVTAVVVGALFGVSVSMGEQVAFASLVDLDTGDIVWFNVATTGTTNDLRTAQGADSLVEALLTDIPL